MCQKGPDQQAETPASSTAMLPVSCHHRACSLLQRVQVQHSSFFTRLTVCTFTSCLTLVRPATLVWGSLLDGGVTLISGLVWLVCGLLQAVFRVTQGALFDAVLTCSISRIELQES